MVMMAAGTVVELTAVPELVAAHAARPVLSAASCADVKVRGAFAAAAVEQTTPAVVEALKFEVEVAICPVEAQPERTPSAAMAASEAAKIRSIFLFMSIFLLSARDFQMLDERARNVVERLLYAGINRGARISAALDETCDIADRDGADKPERVDHLVGAASRGVAACLFPIAAAISCATLSGVWPVASSRWPRLAAM